MVKNYHLNNQNKVLNNEVPKGTFFVNNFYLLKLLIYLFMLFILHDDK